MYVTPSAIRLEPEGWILYQAPHLNNKITEWYRVVQNFKNKRVTDWMRKTESNPDDLDTGLHAWNTKMGICLSKGANNSEIWKGGEPFRMRLTGQRASLLSGRPGNWTQHETFVSVQEMIGPLQNPEREHAIPAPGRN